MIKEIDPHNIDQHSPGAKLDGNKIRAGLLGDFSLALLEVAKVSDYGAKKYSKGGWQFVENGIERYNDAQWRHLLAERHGSIDRESGLLHLAHQAWDLLARLELQLRADRAEDVPVKAKETVEEDIANHVF